MVVVVVVQGVKVSLKRMLAHRIHHKLSDGLHRDPFF